MIILKQRFATIFILSLLCVGLFSNVQAGKPLLPETQTGQTSRSSTVPKKFRKSFVGKIGPSYNIHMDLNRDADNVFGDYYYDTVGTSIEISGSADVRSQFTLTETDPNGTTTGTFKGKITVFSVDGQSLLKLEGTWQKAGAVAPLSFVASELHYDVGLGSKLESKTISQKNKKPKYSIDVEYPQITGLLAPGQEKFNKTISTEIAKQIADFKKENADNDPTPADDTQESSLDIGYDIEMATDGLISISFIDGYYSAGAAHPNSAFSTINYDLKAGKEIKLSEVFKPNTKYLTALSKYCIANLKKTLSEADVDTISTGAAPMPTISARGALPTAVC